MSRERPKPETHKFGIRAFHDDLQPIQSLAAAGFWTEMLDALAEAGAVTQSTAIDSTYIKVQRSAFGGKWGARRKQSVVLAVAGQPRSMP